MLLVLALCYFTYAYTTKNTWPFNAAAQQTQDDSTTDDGINYNPPTEQEITNSQNGKKQDDNSTATPTDKVGVDLAYAGKSDDGQSIEINIFTTDVIEGDGTCTATLSNGASSVSAQSSGFIDARSTICEPITIPLSKLPEGQWSLTIEYASPGKQGSKTGMVVQI
ncbi:MAG: hypothetical protein WAV04_00830 [Candidatus Microsaccharimonas sp.]